jgi:LemA protein
VAKAATCDPARCSPLTPAWPSDSNSSSGTEAEARHMAGLSILIGLVVILFGLGLLIYFITIYNSLVRLRNDIDKAWANIDVLLKQRHDELPKLIETCKGYMQYEQKTLQAITEARTAFLKASTVGEKAQADNMISGALKSLFAVSENYPELKANNNFMQLQHRISELEEMLADRREFFNDDVNTYNIRIQQLPDVFVAGLMSLQRKALFKVAEEDRRDVEVKLA